MKKIPYRPSSDHLKRMSQIAAEKLKLSTEARFWARVKKTDDITECWPWYKKLTFGYYPFMSCAAYDDAVGRTRRNGPAHRIAYWLHYKDTAVGKHICHKCNNPVCCNPHHLYAGNAYTNHLDKVKAGTFKPLPHRFGERVHNSKFTLETVLLIRKIWPILGRSEKSTLAHLLGMSRANLRRVAINKSWQHIKPA